MKTCIFAIAILVSTQNIFPQTDAPIQSLDIHINPHTFLDFTPRLRLGVEYTNSSKISFDCEVGIGNDMLNNLRFRNSSISEYIFLEIRPEVKYNFYSINHLSFYTSLETFMINISQSMKNGSYSGQDTDGTIYFDRADFQKVKYGSHLKIGLRSVPFDRLSFDFYFGMGMARRVIDYTNIINPVYTSEPMFIEWIPQPYRFEGSGYLFHLTAGWKIGILLWKKYSE